ncbi:MAG: sporulation protein YtfJ [Clostridia bacterium]|nr:sporulation protein YtfJ [Clostridia bacterium]
MNESKLNKIIDTSLGNIKQIIDVNTVVGEPITTAGGTVIIPVSKVSLGYASGGVDYYGKHNPANSGDSSFGGGGGTGVTLNPVGFLVTKADGSTEFMPVTTTPNVAPAPDKVDTIISFLERSPELLAKIKAMIPQKKKDASDEEKAPDSVPESASEAAE